jgi:ferredoxin-thioredoxin reductase catalytic subunit
MINFFKDFFRYRKKLKKHDEWIRKFAERKGYSVNPHWMFYTNLKIWLVESEEFFGKRYCPCFEPSGDPELDRKLICPCAFLEQEINERGTCHCTLFGRKDLDSKGYKEAEARLLEEYQGLLNIKDGVLDTRSAPIDPLRGLPIPDPLHQVKRAVKMLGILPLKVIVSNEEFARHIEIFARKNGLKYRTENIDKEHIEISISL